MLVLSGRTTEYSFSPVDEFVIGTIYKAPLVVRRRRERHTFVPGESCVWDPEHVHSGLAPAAAWSAELVIVPACELVGHGQRTALNSTCSRMQTFARERRRRQPLHLLDRYLA
jgi:hypothetical protein